MADATIIYCFDTGPLIVIGRNLKRAFFPHVWDGLEGLVAAGRLVAPREVLTELEVIDDEMSRWAKAQTTLFQPHDQPLVGAVQEILRQFSDLINARKPGGGAADPFVVGLAKLINDSRTPDLFGQHACMVVTTEVGRAGKTNIPAVCVHYGIEFTDLDGFYTLEASALKLGPP